MRRRITSAIVGVTALVLLALGIPLAVVVQQQILDRRVVELQRAAAETLPEIAVPLDPSGLAAIAAEPDHPPLFGVYDATGVRVFGTGPEQLETPLGKALRGRAASSVDGEIVVASPITDRQEQVVGVLRLSASSASAQSQTRRAWLIMAVSGALALAVAWFVARRLAGRLSRPVTDLAAAAEQLGEGQVLDRHQPVGIAEIDLLGKALVDGSQRVTDALARERRFSADVSHQLRTPLAGLRLQLEEAATRTGDTAVADALVDLDRLEGTVTHLLAFSRGALPTSALVDLHAAATDAAARWRASPSTGDRSIVVSGRPDTTVSASASSVAQVLDVLIDNAIVHGAGAVRVDVRTIAGGAAIDVSDEGILADDVDGDAVFHRGHGVNTGIGLALAQSIAEAEGGRLLLARRRPTTFTLVLLDQSI